MEEDIKLQVCRLCFNLISDKNFSHITGSLKDMLQVITTDLNLNVTDVPVMCSECLNTVQEVFNFKTNFFESEEIIESKISDPSLKLDLIDIMQNSCNSRPKRRLVAVKSTKKKLCRTCLEEINGENCIVLKNADVCLLLMLESCLSDLDLQLTSNPVMCLTCYRTLQKMSIFKMMCKENECKIEVFLKTLNINNPINVNLYSVLQFSSSIENYSNGSEEHVKIEPKHEYLEDYNARSCLDYVMVKMEPTDDVCENKQMLSAQSCLDYIMVKVEPTDEVCENSRTPKEENSSVAKKNKKSEFVTKNRPRTRSSYKQIVPKRTSKKYETKRTTNCSDCTFKTKYKYNLRRHLVVTHHQKDVELLKKFYQCSQCDFATRWNLDLTRHMLSHVKPEAFQCTRCPYSTNQNSHLIKHILSHVNAENVDKYRFLQLTKKTTV